MSLEQGLLKKQQVGRDGFYWWLGQVVASKFWIDNNPPLPVGKPDELPGLKRRVKVRIFGYHTAAVSQLTDDDLPWAYCMMPVTAGAAGGGMVQSVNLSGGEFVFGFFLDGEDGQQPIIMGLLDKSSQLTFPKNIPDVGFSPFQGYTNGLVESRDNIKKGGASASTTVGGKEVSGQAGTTIKQTTADESAAAENSITEVEAEGPSIAYENAKITGKVKPANECTDDNPAAGIKLAMERLQAMQSFVEKAQGVYIDPLTNAIGSIDREVERAAQNIAAYNKDIMDKVRAVTIKEAAVKASEMSIKLPIDKMEEFKDNLDEQLDGLGCAFENIMGGLENTLNGLLQDMMGKVTGALDCVINDVIGNMIDSALGALNSVLGSISGALDSLLGATGAIKAPVMEAADFLSSLKELFTCESETKCTDIAQADLNNGNLPEAPSDFAGLLGGALGLGGGGLIPEPVGGILNSASDLSDSIRGIGDAVGGVVDSVATVGQTVGNALETVGSLPGELVSGLQECNPFAGTCEPPLAVIFGGGVTETTANAIINQAGNIIGVDLNGSEVIDRIFDRPPQVHFGSNCGQGDGASGHVDSYPVTVGVGTFGDISVTPWVPIEQNVPDGYVVRKVVMDSPGVNYPPAPDGSVGGSGNTFADADQTIIRDEEGNNVAIKPDRATCFGAGSIVFIPAGGAVEFPEGTVDQQGNDASGYQEGRGLTEGNGFVVDQEYCIVTPKPTKDDNMEDGLSYEVVMELDELAVNQIGISYNDGDTVCIEGDGNTICYPLELSVGGSIIGVTIPDDQRGQGFTDIPTVTINTKTGAGGEITPSLRIKYRGKDNLEEVYEDVTQDQIISVVDCVGKFANV